jgi:hypothetical protein
MLFSTIISWVHFLDEIKFQSHFTVSPIVRRTVPADNNTVTVNLCTHVPHEQATLLTFFTVPLSARKLDLCSMYSHQLGGPPNGERISAVHESTTSRRRRTTSST